MTIVIDCEGAMRQLWDFLDDELTPERMMAIRSHLAQCAGCHSHAQFESAFLEALGRARDAKPASGALRERVLSALRNEGYEPGIGNAE